MGPCLACICNPLMECRNYESRITCASFCKRCVRAAYVCQHLEHTPLQTSQCLRSKSNELLADANVHASSLEELVKETTKSGGALFNNVGQHYNHSFFWNSLSASGGGAPTGAIATKIDEAFGSYDNFKADFVAGGMGQFGSGWVWLVNDGEKL